MARLTRKLARKWKTTAFLFIVSSVLISHSRRAIDVGPNLDSIQPVGSAEHPFAHKSEASNIDIKINGFPEKRIEQNTDITKRNAVWDAALAEGRTLVCLLSMTIAQADEKLQEIKKNKDASSQSSWTTYSQLADNGWTENSDYVPWYAGEDAEDYQIVADWFKNNGWDINKNNPIEMKQSEAVTGYEPSNGFYANVYNPVGGLIVGDKLVGPAYTVATAVGNAQKANPDQVINTPPIVPLRQWSDVSFLVWQRQCELNSVSVANLYGVLQNVVVNANTFAIVRNAFVISRRNFGGWNSRVTFSPDTDAGKAIIGSPNGRGAAWILINHKEQLGVKTISEITVWATSPLDGFTVESDLNILFTFADV